MSGVRQIVAIKSRLMTIGMFYRDYTQLIDLLISEPLNSEQSFKFWMNFQVNRLNDSL